MTGLWVESSVLEMAPNNGLGMSENLSPRQTPTAAECRGTVIEFNYWDHPHQAIRPPENWHARIRNDPMPRPGVDR